MVYHNGDGYFQKGNVCCHSVDIVHDQLSNMEENLLCLCCPPNYLNVIEYLCIGVQRAIRYPPPQLKILESAIITSVLYLQCYY